MSTMSVQDKIEHYQRSIMKYSNDEQRIIHCLEKLRHLPVTVKHLQVTGIGRTVNALRKFQGDSGNLARALINDWKQMVSDNRSSEEDEACVPDAPETYKEEEVEEESSPSPSSYDSRHYSDSINLNNQSYETDMLNQQNSNSSYLSDAKKSRNSKEHSDEKYSKRESEKHNKRESEKSDKHKRESEKQEKHKEKHKQESKSSKSHSKEKESLSKKRKHEESEEECRSKKHKTESSSSSKSKGEERSEKVKKDKHKEESSKHKSSSDSKSKASDEKKKSLHEVHHSKDKSSPSSSKSKTETESSSSNNVINKSNETDKKKEKSEKAEKRHSSHSSSKEKAKKSKSGNNLETGIDCNSGKSFDEALGMCSIPKTSRKRSSLASTSKSIKTESSLPKPSTSSIRKESPRSDDEIKQSPSLLMPNTKLEPLYVNLSATLPEISPNYKPLPKVDTLQCQRTRKQEEERMLSEALGNKNQRTKVYSGNKSKSMYGTVPTLFDLCIRKLIEHIDDIEQIGDIPYYILKPVLQAASPDQLFNIEYFNPYLLEDTNELWELHCRKSFKKFCDSRQENESWREMFMRCTEEREAKLKDLTEGIKRKMIEKAAPVRMTKLAFVDNIVKPPRNVLRKQAKYGTAVKEVAAANAENKKKLLLNSATGSTNISVPTPVRQRTATSSSTTVKKAKAPLMAKALQLIKGRFRR